MAGLTPYQTVGPYLSLGLRAGHAPMRRADGVTAPAITIDGRLVDGAGEGIVDGVLEFWHPAYADVGRAMTGAGGAYVLTTMLPSAVEETDGTVQAPHFAVRVLGRGILTSYVTRVYFPDATLADDPVLACVPADRRDTLMAMPAGDGRYRFDVVLQGERETVFFDV